MSDATPQPPRAMVGSTKEYPPSRPLLLARNARVAGTAAGLPEEVVRNQVEHRIEIEATRNVNDASPAMATMISPRSTPPIP